MCACICIQLHLPTSSQLASFYQCNFFLTLGQLCGFGACNQLLHKIPSYPSHFRKARTAGQGAIKGPPSQPPAVASSPGLHLPSSSLYAFTFSAPFLVLLHHVHSSVNSFPSWQSLVYLTFLWMKWFWLYLWSPFLSFAGPHYFSYFLLEMDGNKTTHTIMMSCILNSFSRMIIFIFLFSFMKLDF